MAFKAPDMAIDLGTSNTMLLVKGKGVVINEPTTVVVNAADHRMVHAVGEEARYLMGRAREHLLVVDPVTDGRISDFDTAAVLLKYFVRKAVGASLLFKPTILVSVPCGLNAVQRKTVREAVRQAGARRVVLIEKPLAAAIGTGLPVYDPVGNMVVDIGAGTTDSAIVAMGGMVVSQSVPTGGNRMDEAIVSYLKKNSSMLIGTYTAERLKIDLGTAVPTDGHQHGKVRGRDLLSSHAMSVDFTSAQAYEALREPCMAILASIRWVLERTPPELSADIMRSGIHLTGGGSRLYALDQFIATQLGIPVSLAREPEECTIAGLGFMLENPDVMNELMRGSN
ncbi:MAG: rod shape-determining protein [Clostridia bacterium]|nr:rod shape-determining protein [Clostridia bacterium]